MSSPLPIDDVMLMDVAQLVYLDVIHSTGRTTSLSKLYQHKKGSITIGELINYYTGAGKFSNSNEGTMELEQKYSNPEEFKQWKEFLNKLNTPEYRNWKIADVVSNNQQDESGMVAFTIEARPGTKIVAFRGSENIADPYHRNDWDNNGSTTYDLETWQQQEARAYIEALEKKGGFDQLYFTGHSLGGNLALYSSFVLSDEAREKLVSATTFNAPGFNRQVLDRYQEAIARMDEAGKIKEFQNIRDAVPGLLYNPTDGIMVDTVSESMNPLDHHAIASYKTDNEGLVVLDNAQRRPEIRLINYLTTGFEAYPGFIKSGVVNTVFRVWNGRLDFADLVFWGGLAALVVTVGPATLLAAAVGTVFRTIVLGFFMAEILPLLQKGWNFITERLQALGERAVQWAIDFAAEVGTIAGIVGKELLEFRDRVNRAVSRFLDGCNRLVDRFIHFAQEQIENARNLWNRFTKRVAQVTRDVADRAVSAVRHAADEVVAGVRELRDRTIQWSGEVRERATQGFRALVRLASRAGRAVHNGLHTVRRQLADWRDQAMKRMGEIRDRTISEIRAGARAVVESVERFRSRVGRLGRSLLQRGGKMLRGFIHASSRAMHGERMMTDLHRLESAERNLRRRQEELEEQIQRVLSVVTNVVNDTERAYSEWYVQSQIREIESLCRQIERENRELSELLRKKSDGLKYSVSKYREVENQLSRSSRMAFV